MAMTSRERVLASLSFQEADRIPIDLGGYPAATSMNVRAYKKFLEYLDLDRDVYIGSPLMNTVKIHDDVLDRLGIDTKSLAPPTPMEQFNAPEFIEPMWKVKWVRSPDYTYAPVEGPLQNVVSPTLADLDCFEWPEPSKHEDFNALQQRAMKARNESDRALIGRMPTGIFTVAQCLRGFENWLLDLVVNKEFCEVLHEKLMRFWIETMDYMLDALGDNVDVLMVADDFGFQKQTMVSPQMFREQLKPYLKKMVAHIKSRTSVKVGIHSCGSVYSLIDDFIDIGLDILNPLQSNAKDMEADKIKNKTKGKLALWGGIDTHEVLPNGDAGEVRKEVEKKISIYKRGGGFIFSADHNILIDVPPENILVMYEAAHEFAKY
jgi:uroporphyrinogen decarboxylase